MTARHMATSILCSAALVSTLFTHSVASQPSLLQSSASDKQPVVRGDFTQKKYLSGMEKPLISHGQFVLARGRGLIWRVVKPIETTLAITDKALVQRRDGQTVKRLSQADHPELKVVSSLMLAVFNADLSQLKNTFHVERREGHGDGWRYQLMPRTDAVKQVVQKIRVRGDQQLRQITIKRPNGDKSVIKLSPHTTQHPKPLSAQEKQRLGGR